MQGPADRAACQREAFRARMNGGGDEILGFHIRRHGLDHGGSICTDRCHPFPGNIGVPVEQDPKDFCRTLSREPAFEAPHSAVACARG